MTRETYLIEMDDVLPSPADVNGDGIVNVTDLILVTNVMNSQ